MIAAPVTLSESPGDTCGLVANKSGEERPKTSGKKEMRGFRISIKKP